MCVSYVYRDRNKCCSIWSHAWLSWFHQRTMGKNDHRKCDQSTDVWKEQTCKQSIRIHGGHYLWHFLPPPPISVPLSGCLSLCCFLNLSLSLSLSLNTGISFLWSFPSLWVRQLPPQAVRHQPPVSLTASVHHPTLQWTGSNTKDTHLCELSYVWPMLW